MKMVSIDCIIVHETDKALLIKTDEKDECWLPKSKVKVGGMGFPAYSLDTDKVQALEIPEWLAFNNCLI